MASLRIRRAVDAARSRRWCASNQRLKPRAQRARRSRAVRALGLEQQRAPAPGSGVSALKAEISTEMAMVSANCWYSRPVMPPMKATGTNTAARISAMPITGPCTSRMALSVASRGDMPCSMWCSTASTTTIASSTTRPMASTRPNSDSVLIEKPSSGKEREGADQRDRHREQRDQGRAPALQEDEHHEHDQAARLDQGHAGSRRCPRFTGSGGVERDRVVDARREALFELGHAWRWMPSRDLERVGAGRSGRRR